MKNCPPFFELLLWATLGMPVALLLSIAILVGSLGMVVGLVGGAMEIYAGLWWEGAGWLLLAVAGGALAWFLQRFVRE